MAKKKYDLITDLYVETVKEVTASPENWLSFLRSACRNFRLTFDDQILIYAQRPEASAVLPIRLPPDGYLEIDPEKDWDFCDGDCRTVREFMEKYPPARQKEKEQER